MKTVSVDDIMRFGPCDPYDRERIEKLFAGREQVTALEILGAGIPARDRLWVVLHEELVPAQVLHEFACWDAARAAVRTAAWDAAWAGDAAGDAAWDAAVAAARNAQITKLEEMLAAVERDGE